MRAHFRYPEDLFTVQATEFANYHVTDPTVFYGKQDFWAIPQDPTVQVSLQARVGVAGVDHQLGHARVDERFDRIRDHRPVVDRQQVLVRDPRERIEPGALAARENDALHAADATASSSSP